MPKPKAILSFEDKTVELEEAQLTRIGKLLLKDDASHQNLKEFNDLYIPVMSVASAMNDWREPPPQFVSTFHTPMYSSGCAEYFLNHFPGFARKIIDPDNQLTTTYPLRIKSPAGSDSIINLLALTEAESTDSTDIIIGVKIQRLYVVLDNEIEAIDVSTNPTASFISIPNGQRGLCLNLTSSWAPISLAGHCDPERGTVRFTKMEGLDVIAVDLEVERGNYNRRHAI